MNHAVARKKTVLLLDDEESDRTKARAALESQGYRVVEAGNCRQGITAFDAHRDEVDLMVLDIALPDGNGCDFALQLWKQRSEVRVLFISGHVGSEVCRFYGLDIGALQFLRKPFTGEELCARVARVLEASEGLPRMHSPRRASG